MKDICAIYENKNTCNTYYLFYLSLGLSCDGGA